MYISPLRKASRLLIAMNEASEEEFPDKARDALNACLVALHHLTDDKYVVMLAARDVKPVVRARQKPSKYALPK